MKRKVTITFFDEEGGGDYEMRCALNATALNIAIWDALQEIRKYIKYDDTLTDKEIERLESLRSILSEVYIEEN